MIVKCKQCGTPFSIARQRKYCSKSCRSKAVVAANVEAYRTLSRKSNRDVAVNGAVVKVRNGRTRVVSAHRMAATGVTDNFEYLRAIHCGCGAQTIHNPYALPEFRSASGNWKDINYEERTAVCPKCAEGCNHERH